MAEQRVVEYGGKRMAVPDGSTQEQVKAQMARFFPELADPKIESKKEGATTVWVFSKKAGTKGTGRSAGPANGRLIERLLATPATPPLPARVVKAVRLQRPVPIDAEATVNGLLDEAGRVGSAQRALLDLPSAAPAAGSVL